MATLDLKGDGINTGWKKGPFGWWWLGPGDRPAQTPDQVASLPPIVAPPSFVPAYRHVTVFDSSTGLSSPLNDFYFADHATAQVIANRYGDGKVYEVPFLGIGPFNATDNTYCTMINGALVNAGLLAMYYTNNPEDQFPDLADRMIKQVLGIA